MRNRNFHARAKDVHQFFVDFWGFKSEVKWDAIHAQQMPHSLASQRLIQTASSENPADRVLREFPPRLAR
jgi:hypothetical protein